MASKIDTNRMGAWIARETALKTVDSSVTWYEQEPNEPPESGADYEYESRDFINAGRKRKKGRIVGLTAASNINIDLTQTNMQRHMEGVLWSNAREKPDTQSLTGTAVAITAVDGTDDEYDAASGLDDFVAGNLVFASGFGVSGNNGLKTVETAGATALAVSESLSAEASPPAAARIEACGIQFPSGDLDVVAGTNTVTLETATTDCTDFDISVGDEIYLGGDETAEQFVSNGPGYARVLSVDTNEIVLDRTDWDAVNETGTGLTIQLFFGKLIRDESATDAERHTIQFERQLGEDDDGVQSEIVTGGMYNEWGLEVETKSRVTNTLSFVGLDVEYRDGATGIKPGTRVSSLCEEFFNTSTDVFVNKIYVHDDTTTNPTNLHGLFSAISLSANNGVTPDEAITVLGGFEASSENLSVSAEGTAYFQTVSQAEAVRNSEDFGWYMTVAKENAGICFDMPLVGAGGGKIEGEKGRPIKMPMTLEAGENCNGYTMGVTFFPYLPDVAMPTQA